MMNEMKRVPAVTSIPPPTATKTTMSTSTKLVKSGEGEHQQQPASSISVASILSYATRKKLSHNSNTNHQQRHDKTQSNHLDAQPKHQLRMYPVTTSAILRQRQQQFQKQQRNKKNVNNSPNNNDNRYQEDENDEEVVYHHHQEDNEEVVTSSISSTGSNVASTTGAVIAIDGGEKYGSSTTAPIDEPSTKAIMPQKDEVTEHNSMFNDDSEGDDANLFQVSFVVDGSDTEDTAYNNDKLDNDDEDEDYFRLYNHSSSFRSSSSDGECSLGGNSNGVEVLLMEKKCGSKEIKKNDDDNYENNYVSRIPTDTRSHDIITDDVSAKSKCDAAQQLPLSQVVADRDNNAANIDRRNTTVDISLSLEAHIRREDDKPSTPIMTRGIKEKTVSKIVTKEQQRQQLARSKKDDGSSSSSDSTITAKSSDTQNSRCSYPPMDWWNITTTAADGANNRNSEVWCIENGNDKFVVEAETATTAVETIPKNIPSLDAENSHDNTTASNLTKPQHVNDAPPSFLTRTKYNLEEQNTKKNTPLYDTCSSDGFDTTTTNEDDMENSDNSESLRTGPRSLSAARRLYRKHFLFRKRETKKSEDITGIDTASLSQNPAHETEQVQEAKTSSNITNCNASTTSSECNLRQFDGRRQSYRRKHHDSDENIVPFTQHQLQLQQLEVQLEENRKQQLQQQEILLPKMNNKPTSRHSVKQSSPLQCNYPKSRRSKNRNRNNKSNKIKSSLKRNSLYSSFEFDENENDSRVGLTAHLAAHDSDDNDDEQEDINNETTIPVSTLIAEVMQQRIAQAVSSPPPPPPPLPIAHITPYPAHTTTYLDSQAANPVKLNKNDLKAVHGDTSVIDTSHDCDKDCSITKTFSEKNWSACITKKTDSIKLESPVTASTKTLDYQLDTVLSRPLALLQMGNDYYTVQNFHDAESSYRDSLSILSSTIYHARFKEQQNQTARSTKHTRSHHYTKRLAKFRKNSGSNDSSSTGTNPNREATENHGFDKENQVMAMLIRASCLAGRINVHILMLLTSYDQEQETISQPEQTNSSTNFFRHFKSSISAPRNKKKHKKRDVNRSIVTTSTVLKCYNKLYESVQVFLKTYDTIAATTINSNNKSSSMLAAEKSSASIVIQQLLSEWKILKHIGNALMNAGFWMYKYCGTSHRVETLCAFLEARKVYKLMLACVSTATVMVNDSLNSFWIDGGGEGREDSFVADANDAVDDDMANNSNTTPRSISEAKVTIPISGIATCKNNANNHSPDVLAVIATATGLIGAASNNIANVYKSIRHFENAEKYYRGAIRCYKDILSVIPSTAVLNNEEDQKEDEKKYICNTTANEINYDENENDNDKEDPSHHDKTRNEHCAQKISNCTFKIIRDKNKEKSDDCIHTENSLIQKSEQNQNPPQRTTLLDNVVVAFAVKKDVDDTANEIDNDAMVEKVETSLRHSNVTLLSSDDKGHKDKIYTSEAYYNHVQQYKKRQIRQYQRRSWRHRKDLYSRYSSSTYNNIGSLHLQREYKQLQEQHGTHPCIKKVTASNSNCIPIAIQFYRKSLRMLFKLPDGRVPIARTLTNLGQAHLANGEWKKSAEAHDAALKLYQNCCIVKSHDDDNEFGYCDWCSRPLDEEDIVFSDDSKHGDDSSIERLQDNSNNDESNDTLAVDRNKERDKKSTIYHDDRIIVTNRESLNNSNSNELKHKLCNSCRVNKKTSIINSKIITAYRKQAPIQQMAETLKWIGEIHDSSMEFDNALLRYREALKWYYWLMNMNTNINKEATNQNDQIIQPTWLHQRGKMQKSKQSFKYEYYEQIEQLLGTIISVEESLLLSKESLFTV